MKIKDKVKPKQPPIPPAVYPGICIGVIDLGEQYSEMFKKYDNKVQIVWELPTAPMIEVDGEQKPRQLSKLFTLAANKKSNLRKLLTSWNGIQYSDEQFSELDLFAQLGKPCFINVTLNDTGEYNNIDSVTPPMQGYPIPATTTPFIQWDMDAWDDAVFATLPEWIQEKIKKSTQYQKAHPPTTVIDFQANMSAQVPQPAAPVAQPAPIQQTAQAVQQTAPQVQQTTYATPTAPGAVNPQAYQIPYQGAAQPAQAVQQTVPVIQPAQAVPQTAPVVQQTASTQEEVPF